MPRWPPFPGPSAAPAPTTVGPQSISVTVAEMMVMTSRSPRRGGEWSSFPQTTRPSAQGRCVNRRTQEAVGAHSAFAGPARSPRTGEGCLELDGQRDSECRSPVCLKGPQMELQRPPRTPVLPTKLLLFKRTIKKDFLTPFFLNHDESSLLKHRNYWRGRQSTFPLNFKGLRSRIWTYRWPIDM